MLQPDEVVVVLVGHCGHDPQFGRTALQKVAYLAGAIQGSSLGHSAYHYGPYSRGLDRATTKLVRQGLIEESVEHLGFISATGHPARRFSYRLTGEGEALLAELEHSAGDEVKHLRSLADRISNEIGGLDQAMLSLAAKTHFLLSDSGQQALTPEEISSAAKELGWRVSAAQIESIATKLEGLRLVTTMAS
jgi:Uncharacterized conserved protein